MGSQVSPPRTISCNSNRKWLRKLSNKCHTNTPPQVYKKQEAFHGAMSKHQQTKCTQKICTRNWPSGYASCATYVLKSNEWKPTNFSFAAKVSQDFFLPEHVTASCLSFNTQVTFAWNLKAALKLASHFELKKPSVHNFKVGLIMLAKAAWMVER